MSAHQPDVLSQVLRSVRMSGAIFFDVTCSEPWGFAVPAVGDMAQTLAPGTQRLVNYHLVMDGRVRVDVDGEDVVMAEAGDVVVLTRGDAHSVRGRQAARLVPSHVPLREALSGRPRAVRLGGDGDASRIVCGFLGCDRVADRLFLAGLPPVFRVRLRDAEAGRWIWDSIDHLVAEARDQRPGAAALLSRMAEALFVEMLRVRMMALGPDDRGWLAGAHDPVVGVAMALLHDDPGRRWTTAELARATGASRSVIGERFARYLGESPMTYLARWRLQVAAFRLETTQDTVLEICTDVGYSSESAFNRAFKREFGLPPGRFRRLRRTTTGGPTSPSYQP